MRAADSNAGPASSFDITADALLTAADAARLLTVSIASVRRLQQQRRIPFVKIRGSIRYVARDLAAYVAKQRVESVGQ